MIAGNAMVKTVCCHLHGGHVALRRSNMGCAVYCPGKDNWKTSYSLCRGHGLPFGDPTQAKGSDSQVAAHLARPGKGDQAGGTLLPPIPRPLPDSGSGLCRFAGAWSWCCSPWPPVLPVLGPGAADPGPVSCLGTGVLLLLSAPKDLRTVPENTVPPYGSCTGQANTF